MQNAQRRNVFTPYQWMIGNGVGYKIAMRSEIDFTLMNLSYSRLVPVSRLTAENA